jgi:NTE family protein
VLKRLLAEEDIEIVALSGTSGGALCAMLAWRGLLENDREQAIHRLGEFWRDNVADGLEEAQSWWFLEAARAVGELASWEVSPYYTVDDARDDLRELLERHCGFVEVPRLLERSDAAPRLLISATEVRTGEFAVFRSHDVSHRGVRYRAERMTADVLLASAAIPTLFRAVDFHGQDYWDGVFAQNPPIRELPDMVRTIPAGQPPDEIWIVRINPQTCEEVPRSMSQIRDRRNELAGTISLGQELYMIDLVNRLIDAGHLGGRRTKHRCITLRSIRMSAELAGRLDYESKLERGREHLTRLDEDGHRQAEDFLANRSARLEPEADHLRCR